MAMGTLADRIRQQLGELSPAERRVGRVLLADYPAAGFETVAVVAERARVSAPTVLRFVGRFGFRGFPDFQAGLRAELDERSASPLSLYEASDRGASEQEGDESLLDQGRRVFTAALAQTYDELPPHDLERAIELLGDPKRRITLTGGRFTHHLAQYLALHLMQLRDGVSVLSERTVERTAALTGWGRRDVLVVFDYRRYEPDKAAFAELLGERGGRVVLFTDTWLSPAAAHSEVVLATQVTAPSPYDSLVPTMAVIETVVAGLVRALGEEAHARLKEGERLARATGMV
ncbi:MurR/RpiR family transcriptional regulator [Streptomyces sp. VRA16 Mangrove soil]|uniref:MurR/RpiR family transcriptional regulator n=1 Tax=Streptomyces sp. VRA16 Mangrove soil TaxID=2817434 RepID=UPI001A9F517A|nr:MurR/RpiR family transcriptional regulator [Streptomyces sp. VRA16 Mangrove soil]MBO1332319.1 MurR/RpiR family transcriptional regulator [Streptomyces sp. VRA16 Mangrove soil]